MTTVGIIGGGQLAQMTAQAAQSLGISVALLPDSDHDPAIKYADYVAPNLTELADRSGLITFENEFIDLQQLAPLAQQGTQFFPSLNTLAILVDKYQQRSFLREHHLPTPDFNLVDVPIKNLSFPVVMKICRCGYDGRGTKIIHSLEELNAEIKNLDKLPAIIENFIDFKQELAIMACRSVTGEISLFPVVETVQIQQVCRRVIAPARISHSIKTAIENIAATILEKLNYVGILGIEFFLTNQDQILVNEMAPRPHNSGHYTIEGCTTSQFSQFLRSILGIPLSTVTMTTPVAIMVNLLGLNIPEQSYPNLIDQVQQFPKTHLHWYDKQPRPGRKLGHITVLGNDYHPALEIAHQIEQTWYHTTR